MLNLNQYNKLIKYTKEILVSDDAQITTIAIPWLHLIRAHPVFLKNYNFLFFKNDKLSSILIDLSKKLIKHFVLKIRLFISIFENKLKWVTIDQLPEKSDYLFISHFINISQLDEQTDFYFSNIPNQLQEIGRTVVIGLINHVPKRLRKADLKNNIVKRLYFKKRLNYCTESDLFKQLKSESKKLKQLSSIETDPFKKNILFNASGQSLDASTISVMRIGKQIEELVKYVNPKVIITTFEGHAFERIIFASARKVKHDIICISYQHTVVFELSNSIKYRLKTAYNPDFIFTSGECALNLLKAEPEIANIPIDILGSSRGIFRKSNIEIQKKYFLKAETNICLVIPEGIEDEVVNLFKFSLSCARLMPEIKFIWRLHPCMSFSKIKNKIDFFRNLPSNIMLSENNLENDINSSNWVLYRGTTSVFKAIAQGLRPIYLELDNENMSIDPLFRMSKWKVKVKDVKSFLDCIKNDLENNFAKNSLYIKYGIDFCNYNFSEINISNLDRVLSQKNTN
jgi:hypothetical protein